MKKSNLIILSLMFLFVSCKNDSSIESHVGELGKLFISSSPQLAKILLSGEYTEKTTPDTLYLISGYFQITLQLEEFIDTSFYVNVDLNSITRRYINLRSVYDMPNSDISYIQHLQPLFNVRCAVAGCHNDTSRAGGLRLTSCANTTADPSVVFPGEPDNSRLLWAVEGIGNYPMPPQGYTSITQNQIKGIRTWIKEGAKCN